MNFVSPPNVRLSTINVTEKLQLQTSNSRFFHFVFISFVIAQVAHSISVDFTNPQIEPKSQFLRGFIRIIPNAILIAVFHMHSKVDYKLNYKKSNILEFILLLIALGYYIGSDYTAFNDLVAKHTPTRSEIMLPAFSLGLESFWRFFMFYAIARRGTFVVVYILIMLCFYLIMTFSFSYWLLGGKIFFQIIIMWGVISYAERIKIKFFLENRKLQFQDKVQRVVLNSLPESMLVLTEQGDVKYTNRYMSGIFGITNQEKFQASLENFSSLKFRDYIEDDMLKSLPSRHTSNMKTLQQNGTSVYAGQKNDVALLINDPSTINRSHTNGDIVKISDVAKIQTVQDLMKYLKANVSKWRKTINFALIFDTKYKHPTGTISSIELKAYVFHDDGEVEFILILRDTTYRDQIASLESANADYRNNVLATFSHELRTPLNSNLGLLEHCMDSPDITKNVKKTIIEPALISSKLLLYLVNDILDYSQFLNMNLELNFSKKSLKTTIQSCVDLFKDRVKEKNLNLSLELQELDEPFNTDHGRVSQIIVNLLGNALKFTAKGKIYIQSKRDQGDIFKLSVIDTGIGMDQETQDRLRRNMEKGEFREKINSNTAGMGIGLFISNMLAYNMLPGKNMGIQFESKKDEGTTFYFYIENKNNEPREILFEPEDPLNQLTFPSVGSEVDEVHVCSVMRNYDSKLRRNYLNLDVSNQASTRYKVLIVDDEVMNVIVLEAFCKSFGVATERAFDGKQAIEKILSEGPETTIKLVLTDVNMPVMDGYETAKTLKKLIKENKIPKLAIVGVTAYVAREKLDKCLQCGMDEVFNKPLSKNSVFLILKRYGVV